ncbi:MAG TPA: segregation/condensation protein A, partial [Pseudomonas sp.]|nr:segregation/condensation protein A [Pseudomonas sp.]
MQPTPTEADAIQPGEQLRLALVYGEAFNELPLDLYIPPDALEVFLEAF